MEKINIGFSRFYNAGACSIDGAEEVTITFKFEKFDINVYAGTGLKHKIFSLKLGPPVSKDDAAPKKASRANPQQLPSIADFPADFYVEFFVSEWIEVEDFVAAAFKANDPSASNYMTKIINQRKEDYAGAVDYAAGFIGLKLHKLLVNRPIHEQYEVFRNNNSSFYSLDIDVTVTDTFSFDKEENWQKELHTAGKFLSGEKWKTAAETLTWLLRAWDAEDRILRCFSLLTALEQVIPGPPSEKDQQWKESQAKILSILKTETRSQDKVNLITWVDSLKPPATPVLTRFEIWAAEAALPGWQKDIATFRKFNRIRNKMFHSGKPGIEYRVKIDLKPLEELEDLTERYVSWGLFNNANVYKHPLRR